MVSTGVFKTFFKNFKQVILQAAYKKEQKALKPSFVAKAIQKTLQKT